MSAVDMSNLPDDVQYSVWEETERNFWTRFDAENEEDDAETKAQYQRRVSAIRNDLDALTNKRTQLAERQENLFKELTQVEEDLAQVVEACDNQATMLHTLHQDYSNIERENLEKRSQITTKMENFFFKKKGAVPNASSIRGRQHFHEIVRNTPTRPLLNRDAVHAEALQQANEVARSTEVLPSVKPATLISNINPDNVLVNVVDSNGRIIGPVQKIDAWNQWIEAIQNMPVKRPVKIRRGRKFTQEHLATIYDCSEAKGVKWIACMIQATGEIQQQRCHSCDKNQGAFDDCIILGGSLFQKCGNCEWNRQGCHMPLARSIPANTEPSRGFLNFQSQGGSERLAYREQPNYSHDSPAMRLYRSHPEPTGVAELIQLPTPKDYGFSNQLHNHSHEQHNHHHNNPPHQPRHFPTSGSFTPANNRTRPPSREILTPSIQSAQNSPQPMPQAEITRSNLALRHNGTVYTYPECVKDVPLVKINQHHPYWDPRWPTIESIISPQLEQWKIKYNEAIQKKAKGEGGSAKFQTGRQVNRGIKILEFLEEGDICPYQLLSKQYTHTGKGTITAYDTLFRMCETLGELGKFRLEITPVEWLRHRLHEIILEEGVNFNYSKTMHDFYHDPKLAALRDKNGFKSIGRPSGFKAGQSSSRGVHRTPSMKKRKSMHLQIDTPRETPSAGQSPPVPLEEDERSPTSSTGIPYTAEPAFNSLQKRMKPLSPVSAPPNDEFHTEDVTDTDSQSNAPLTSLDWRVHQVKTRLSTSQSETRQYWHWKEDKRAFEHQVLKETEPAVWSLLRNPIDFDIPLDDIVQVDWNMDALQIHFTMSQFGSSESQHDGKSRGDVMAAFMRATTMRRFLNYCRQRRLKLTKITTEEIEQRWAAMQSEKLP